VTAQHFPAGFVAPKMVTPENAKQVVPILANNETPLSPLLGLFTQVPLSPKRSNRSLIACRDYNESGKRAFMGSVIVCVCIVW
jgi:hypothetical protein